MTILQILLLIGIVAVVVIIALIVINYLQKKDEQDLLSEGFVIYFNRKTKQFEQWPVNYFNKHVVLNQDDWTFVVKSFNSEIDDLNIFLKREKYHVSTGKQAIKAFDEYAESKMYE
jgi:hypothetical protein